ncbi:MAG: rod-binding protein [Lachnospiraceae bacterium]|nr:rod-binding protein [Candidatus Colinaster scatohippi]
MSTIDISGLTSVYSDFASQKANELKADKLKNVANSANSEATDKELMDACKQFESYFLEQVFKQMWKTVDTKESNDQSTSNLVDFFKDSTLQELASQSTETNSLGLAQMLYEQMKRNIEG